MNFFSTGPFEIVIIILVAFIVLGPTKLVATAKNIGKLIREVRGTVTQFTRLIEEDTSNHKTDTENKSDIEKEDKPS